MAKARLSRVRRRWDPTNPLHDAGPQTLIHTTILDPMTLNQRVQGSSPCAPTKYANVFIELYGYPISRRFATRFMYPLCPQKTPAVPGRDRVERSGSRDFSAQIPHTQPSGSMVRVLIAPPISRRTAEIFLRLRQKPPFSGLSARAWSLYD